MCGMGLDTWRCWLSYNDVLLPTRIERDQPWLCALKYTHLEGLQAPVQLSFQVPEAPLDEGPVVGEEGRVLSHDVS